MPIDALRVVTGGPDLCGSSTGLDFGHVERVDIPQAYRAPGWAFDVALLTLSARLGGDLDLEIGAPASGSTVIAYGWSGAALSHSTTCSPKAVELKVLRDADCSARLGKAAVHYDRSVSFCAVGIGANTCQGDSGGPVFSREPTRLVGVVSWGVGCGIGDVGVYALPFRPN